MVISNESITSHSKLLYWGVITKGCYLLLYWTALRTLSCSLINILQIFFLFLFTMSVCIPYLSGMRSGGCFVRGRVICFFMWVTEWFAGGFVWDRVICRGFHVGHSDLLGVSWGAEWFAWGFVRGRVICCGFCVGQSDLLGVSWVTRVICWVFREGQSGECMFRSALVLKPRIYFLFHTYIRWHFQ